jgi:type II secretory ATPase GspE/PulE/Tfp pilus assembly ATPase PilB-like protein
MGAEPFLIASTTNVVIAQRLVRKLCPDCRKEYKLTEKELKAFGENYDMERIMETIKKSGMAKGRIESKTGWLDVKLYKSVGCEQCNGGYKGRIGIFEVLEIDDVIRKMISQKASSDELDKAAREKGMIFMVEDGFIKAVQGTTSLEEILRVTKE